MAKTAAREAPDSVGLALNGVPVYRQVAALQELELEGLRRLWRSQFGTPPKLRSVELLRQMLAWRLQAAAFGGLDRQTRQALERTAAPALRSPLAPGVRLAREYRGVQHQVEVVADGFRYLDQTYPSLSVIARRITGTRWNGWRFFGLTEPKL